MNFDDNPEEAAFRQQARAWVADNAPHYLLEELENAPFFSLHLRSTDAVAASKDWQRSKYASGWACLNWPTDYGGRGASPIERVIWEQEEGTFGKLGLPLSIGIGMVGPTLMQFADDAARKRHLPRIASGEEIWCQLFSEPGAGSDLANVATSARREGDLWRINGQKVWTSWAHEADYGLLLARTAPEKPKHQGLSAFFIDMRQPGVTIRPIRQMNEKCVFNEVFFDDAVVPDRQRLGEVDAGWRVAVSTLMHERFSASGMPTGFEQLFQLVQDLRDKDDRPLLDDAAVRDKVARAAVVSAGLRNTRFRTISSLSQGQEPGPENSIGKLAAAQTMQQITRYAVELLGEEGQVLTPGDKISGWFQSMFLRAPALRIEAGSDEILRNIIAERVLGLPADPASDRHIPFNRRSEVGAAKP